MAFFSYFTSNGMGLLTIDDQTSFEVALNHLYHKRHKSEITALMFRPGSDEARQARVERDEEEERIEREDEDRIYQMTCGTPKAEADGNQDDNFKHARLRTKRHHRHRRLKNQ
jgi:hypothetical protein